MKSSYAIAYKDKNGKDFNGIPWILDDIQNENDCIANTKRLINDEYQNVIPFKFSERRKSTDEFNWEYVKRNQIQFLLGKVDFFE